VTAPGWQVPTPADGRRPAGYGLTRTQVLPVLVALACVVVAAVVMRVSEPAYDFDASRTSVGRPASLNGGELTVRSVRAGQRISYSGSSDKQLTTKGMFVVLDVEVAAGVKKQSVGSYQLTADGYTYGSYQSLDTIVAAPGYVGRGSVVFEVDPAHIDDLTATIWQNEILSGYQQRVILSVGITAANAAQWRESAANRLLTVSEYPDQRPA
jgi:hypothetical protein